MTYVYTEGAAHRAAAVGKGSSSWPGRTIALRHASAVNVTSWTTDRAAVTVATPRHRTGPPPPLPPAANISSREAMQWPAAASSAHCMHSAEASTAYGERSLSTATMPVSTMALAAMAADDSVRYVAVSGTDDGRNEDTPALPAAAASESGSMDSAPFGSAYTTFTSIFVVTGRRRLTSVASPVQTVQCWAQTAKKLSRSKDNNKSPLIYPDRDNK